jgi:alkanesulfonate monooxygenase SsuD/methylene tetrahydromethanopterin reductase-like flavin-dependent oxidoreductase (luciferase family)
VLAYGDEWMPNRSSEEELTARIAELQARAAEVGRERIPVTVMGSAPDAARIDRLAEAGVDRIVFWLPQDTPHAVEEGFDRYVAAMEQFQTAG